MLQDTHETVISTKELESLRKELKELKENYDGMIAQIKKEEAEKREKAISAATKNLELVNKAQNATVIAFSEQQKREIETLKSTITDLRNEVQMQRNLTQSVAEAGRHQMNYMHQPQTVR